MSQAEKTLLRYQYVMAQTKTVQGDFAFTADTWANRIKMLKQQLQTIGAVLGDGIINAVKPVVAWLNVTLNSVMAFSRNVVNALGKIFGWEMEVTQGGQLMSEDMIDALEDESSTLGAIGDAADDAADKVSKAAKANKEYERTVLGFDELNKLNKEPDNSDSGSSPSSGSGKSGKSGAGVIIPTGIKASDVAVSFKRIKKGYESEIDNLFDLGEYIGKTITTSINEINWEQIQTETTSFGTGFAEFLNGLISDETGASLGAAFGGLLTAGLGAASGFVNTFEFTEAGTSIAAFVNAAVDSFDFNLLVTTVDKFVRGVWDLAVAAFGGIEWDDINTKIQEGIDSLDSPVLSGAWEGFVKFFTDAKNAITDLVDVVSPYLEKFFDVLDGEDGTVLKGIGEGLGYVFGAIMAFKVGATVATTIKGVAGSISTMIAAIGPWGAVAVAATAFSAFLYGVITDTKNWKSEDAKKIHEIASAVDELSTELASKSGLKDAQTNYQYLSDILDKYLELNEKLVSGEGLTDEEEALFESYYSILAEKVPDIVTKIGEIGEAYTGTKEDLQALINEQYKAAQEQYYIGLLDNFYKQKAEVDFSKKQMTSNLDKNLLEAFHNTQNFLGDREVSNISDEQFLEWVEQLKNGVEFEEGSLEWLVFNTADGKDIASAMDVWNDYNTAMAEADATIQQINTDISLCADSIAELKTGTVEATGETKKFSTAFNTLKSILSGNQGIFANIKNGLAALWDGIKKNNPEIDNFATTFRAAAHNMRAGTTGLQNAFKNTFSGMKSAVKDGTKSAKDTMGKFSQWWNGTLVTTTEGSLGTLNSAASEAKITEEEMFAQPKKSAIKHLELKGGVSNLMNRIGKYIPAGLISGMKARMPDIETVAARVPARVKNGIGDIANALVQKGRLAIHGVGVGIKEKFTDLEKASSGVSSHVKAGIGDIAANLVQKGRLAIHGVGVGIKEKFTDLETVSGKTSAHVKNGIGDIATELVQKGKLAIHGVGVGIKDQYTTLEKTASSTGYHVRLGIGDIAENVKPKGKAVITGMKAGIDENKSTLTDDTATIPGSIVFSLGDIAATLKPKGEDVPNGLKDGVDSAKPGLSGAVSAVLGVLTGVSINQDQKNKLWQTGRDAVDSLKNGWTSQTIPAPHFTVSTKNSTELNTKVPTVAIDWYASGGLVTNPSVIGVGEAGHEAVLPLTDRGAMKEIASALVAGMVDSGAMANAVARGMIAAGAGNQPIVVNATLRTENDEVLARAVTRGQQRLNYRTSPVGV